MTVEICETISRTYRIDSETLEEFRENSEDLTTNGLLNYLMENYYIDDFLVDEEVDDIVVDKEEFNNFINSND